MKHIEKKILEQINEYDSITLGYMKYVDTKLEIGLTSYIDIDFIGDIYSLLRKILFSYKNQSVKITVIDVNDGDKNPLDAIISIEI
ncbi:MAG: hypothetical protein IKF82_00515 [Bacilli bacterium]|nr:hypothetical protein [Bacilli bacterium]